MARIVLLAVLLFLGYTLYSALRRSLSGPPPGAGKPSKGEEMVKDPQCGTYIPRSQAVDKTVGGQQLFFCSPQCRDRYRSGNK